MHRSHAERRRGTLGPIRSLRGEAHRHHLVAVQHGQALAHGLGVAHGEVQLAFLGVVAVGPNRRPSPPAARCHAEARDDPQAPRPGAERSLEQLVKRLCPQGRRNRRRRAKQGSQNLAIMQARVRPERPAIRLLWISISLYGWLTHPSAPATGNHRAQVRVR
jgi:hypothetical protein